MMNLLKNRGIFLFFAAVAIFVASTICEKNVLAQTTQIKDFSFRVTVDCNSYPIEEISTNGTRALSIYHYPVEFLAKSVTYENGTIILHDAFLYKHTYRSIYGQPHTEYFDPAEHPENFLQSITIYPQSRVVIKEIK